MLSLLKQVSIQIQSIICKLIKTTDFGIVCVTYLQTTFMKRLFSTFLLFLFLVCLGSSFSYSQKRKMYKSGEGPAKVTIRKDSVKKKPQKVLNQPVKKVCNCNTDLSFDPTTRIAMNKNKTGNPPFTGTCIAFFKNKKLEMKLSYVNGKEDGKWLFFYESGFPKIIKHYAEGKPHGKWTAFEDDSVLFSINNYSYGKEHGKQIYFYPGGKIKKRVEDYLMGVKNGTFEQYYKDGVLKKTVTYKNNKFDGPYNKYTRDSVLIIEKEYKEGEIEGKDNSYFDDGSIAYKTFYKKGKPEGEWIFNFEDGTPQKIENYKKGKKDGEWKEYHNNGKIKHEILYKKDKIEEETKYDKFGEPLKGQ